MAMAMGMWLVSSWRGRRAEIWYAGKEWGYDAKSRGEVGDGREWESAGRSKGLGIEAEGDG